MKFKGILKAIGKGVLDAIPIVPNFIELAESKNKEATIRKLVQEQAKAVTAKNISKDIRVGANDSARFISKLQDVLDTIDDGKINQSIPEDKAEKIVRAITTVFSGGLILYGFVQQILQMI
jgi:hypothetical protein